MAYTATLTRKAVRDALRSVLSNATTGFNQRLSDIASTYGIVAPAIDWGPGSKSVYFAYIDSSDIAKTQLDITGDDVNSGTLCLLIYTKTADQTRQMKPRTFSGEITAYLDFYLYRRTGISTEVDDIESYADAIEDAAATCLENPQAAWPAGVTYRKFTCVLQPVELLSDGYRRVIPMECAFFVNA